MPTNSIFPPYTFFTDTTGAPLESGQIYIGTAGLEARTTPKASFFDLALTIPTGTASGSAIVTKGGFPVRNGAPAAIYVDGDYSISVLDKNGVLLYSALNSTIAINVGGSAAQVLAADGNLGAPGLSFANESNTGLLRPSAGTLQTSITGTLVSSATTAGTVFQQPVSGAGFTSGVAAALDADLTAIAALSGTGLAARTAANTWALRQIVSTDGTVAITNPAGVAGNIDLAANVGGNVASVALSGSASPLVTSAVPSAARRITVGWTSVSTDGTSEWGLRVGAGSILGTGYAAASYGATLGGSGALAGALRFPAAGPITAGAAYSGKATLTRMIGENWFLDGVNFRTSDGVAWVMMGSINVSGGINRVGFNVAGSDTFDGGSGFVMWDF